MARGTRPPSFHARITRRDFLNGMALGAGTALPGSTAAAFEFNRQRKDGQTCLMLDNQPIFGGAAKENEFDVGGTRLIAPQGATGSAPRDTIRRHYGRIAFAHSELDGLQHWGTAADEGRRAFTQLAGAL